MDVCNAALVHHIAPHGDADGELDCIDQRQQDDAADDVEVQVDEGGALAVLGGAADGQQGVKAVPMWAPSTMGMAELKVTRPVLESACRIPTEAEEDWMMTVTTTPTRTPRDGVGHGDEQLLERCALTQGRHAGVHRAHAREQDAEAQHDPADVLFFTLRMNT